MPGELKILLASIPLEPGNKPANLAHMGEFIASHGGARPDLCIFGEANLNGGLWTDGLAQYADLAEQVPEGPSCQAVIQMARQYKTVICAGLLERSPDGRFFVTHFLCGPTGYLGKQRKIFANNARQQRFSDGTDGVSVFDIAGHRCCILACADLLFPEPVLLAAVLDVELLIAPIDAYDASHQPMLCRVLAARAWDTGACAVAVFGHDSAKSSSSLMAAAAASSSGELLTCQTRLPSESSATKLRLSLAPPDRRWGHPAHRLVRIIPQFAPILT